MLNSAVISVGSNIDPEANIEKARLRLSCSQKLVGVSAFVRTRPIGKLDQPDFLNGAFLVSTGLERSDFIKLLKEIENELGRVRTADKYGPRSIDLDLVVWNGRVVDEDFYSRSFVRDAVVELLPELDSQAGLDRNGAFDNN